jgi:hypothetical protein
MAVHDWTRVSAGTFHHFHSLWIGDLCKALNGGVLPAAYYAMGEQIAQDIGPDVLTLQSPVGRNDLPGTPTGATAVAEARPAVSVVTRLDREASQYARRRRTLVIRHASGHRIVALIEIISPGNKSSRQEWERLLDKLTGSLWQGYHVLVIDLLPPGYMAPEGIHGALVEALAGGDYEANANKPLTLASYVAGVTMDAYVEPISVGDLLPDMPLFLDPRWYVNVPLETTYTAAWSGIPAVWKQVLEA